MDYMRDKDEFQSDYEIWQGILQSAPDGEKYNDSFNVQNNIRRAIFRLAREGRLNHALTDDFGTVKFLGSIKHLTEGDGE